MMGIRIVAAVLAVTVLGARANAQEEGQPANPPRSKTSARAEVERLLILEQELSQLIEKQEWDAAAENCQKQIDILPERSEPYYNLACIFARSKKNEEALAALSSSIEHGWAEPAHMRADPDLEPLRVEKAFDELLAKARQNETAAPYDKGEPIEGVRSVEAFPEDGMRYRLRIGKDATAEKRARLIIWLHPSGGSMNSIVEKLSPAMAKHGYALLVITRKNFAGWSQEHFDLLREKTLADVAKTPEVDTRRPILLGYSAGGQMAINAWAKNPERWGGLILDAAYPLDVEQLARGRISTMALPIKDEIKKCPIYVLVGGADDGLKLWDDVRPHWLEAGVPLTFRSVEEKGHTWLLNDQTWTDVARWLDEVAAEKLPSDPIKKAKE